MVPLPETSSGRILGGGGLFRFGRVEADAEDLAGVGIGGLEAPAAGVEHRFALLRDAAGEQEDQAAERVDLVLDSRQACVDRLGQLLQLCLLYTSDAADE